jgi:hypothetical protein
MFRTVFIADLSRVHLWAPLPFLVVAGAMYAGSLWVKQRSRHDRIGVSRLWALRVATVLAVLGALLTAVTTWAEYRVCSTPIDGKDVSVVAGRVRDFKPMPAEGHAYEEFAVNGVVFAFSGIGESCSFNHAAVFGGPLREGLVVRIFYRSGRILRLDVAD